MLVAMPVFAELSINELLYLQAYLRPRSSRAGTQLLSLDQPNDAVYFVSSGSVKVYIQRVGRQELVLNLLGPGEVLGEMSAADRVPASATAATVEATSLLWMEGAAFKQCLKKLPRLLGNLLAIQNRRMRRLTSRVEAIATMDVSSRLAQQLLIFAHDYGKFAPAGETGHDADGILLPLRLKQSDLAGLIGSSREQVNRVLSRYQTQGYISIGVNSHIVLHNLRALEEQCR